jgi:hypothetical protein
VLSLGLRLRHACVPITCRRAQGEEILKGLIEAGQPWIDTADEERPGWKLLLCAPSRIALGAHAQSLQALRGSSAPAAVCTPYLLPVGVRPAQLPSCPEDRPARFRMTPQVAKDYAAAVVAAGSPGSREVWLGGRV